MHHIKNKTIIRNQAIEYAGDVMLILAWYKMLDDAHDEGKTSAKAAAQLLKRLHRKLQQKYPALCDGIEINLAETERSGGEPSAQASMKPRRAFSKIMEVIFRGRRAALVPDFTAPSSRNLCRTGYHMGKWIYLIDAADDIEENIESGAYNPLLLPVRLPGQLPEDRRLPKRPRSSSGSGSAAIWSSTSINIWQFSASRQDHLIFERIKV